MTETLPDQKQLWDAYGHAMGAAVGLELLMRIALVNHAAHQLMRDNRFDEENRERVLADIQGMTFGRTVGAFKKGFPDFAENADFCESIENAVSSRNYLAHGFLDGILHGLRSEEGIQLIVLDCVDRLEHFQSVDSYIRDRCPIDFDEFFKLGEGKADQYVENHPLREKLRAIKSGRLQR
jgi:hypothetical protein